MFSICFQSDQEVIHTHLKQKEKNIHSSHAKPKTKTSAQLVGIADYMDKNLEVNDNHKIQIFQTYRQDI